MLCLFALDMNKVHLMFKQGIIRLNYSALYTANSFCIGGTSVPTFPIRTDQCTGADFVDPTSGKFGCKVSKLPAESDFSFGRYCFPDNDIREILIIPLITTISLHTTIG